MFDEDFYKFIDELARMYHKEENKKESASEETSEPVVKPTKAMDVLDFLVDASFDCGDVIMIPKRLIIEVRENIID